MTAFSLGSAQRIIPPGGIQFANLDGGFDSLHFRKGGIGHFGVAARLMLLVIPSGALIGVGDFAEQGAFAGAHQSKLPVCAVRAKRSALRCCLFGSASIRWNSVTWLPSKCDSGTRLSSSSYCFACARCCSTCACSSSCTASYFLRRPGRSLRLPRQVMG